MDLSIVIPLFNENDSIIPLSEEIVSICQENNIETEVIFINDGSTDESIRRWPARCGAWDRCVQPTQIETTVPCTARM